MPSQHHKLPEFLPGKIIRIGQSPREMVREPSQVEFSKNINSLTSGTFLFHYIELFNSLSADCDCRFA